MPVVKLTHEGIGKLRCPEDKRSAMMDGRLNRRCRPKFPDLPPPHSTTGHRQPICRSSCTHKAWKTSCLNKFMCSNGCMKHYSTKVISNMNTEAIITMYSGFSCKRRFLNRFQREILFIAPAVPEGVPFTTEQLCGTEYWDPLSKLEMIMVGICMLYLVEDNRVPFELVPRTGRNPYPLQFQIKTSYTPNR